MKPLSLFYSTIACALAVAAPRASGAGESASNTPHLRQQGTAAQLIVDGKPFLVLSAELGNNSGTSLEYMKSVWPKLVEAKVNTLMTGVSWAQIEPVEGKYDFRIVDGLIQEARSHNLRFVPLWFASSLSDWNLTLAVEESK